MKARASMWVFAVAFLGMSQAAVAGLDGNIVVHIEEPTNGGYKTGVSNLRGWAVTPYGDFPIDYIEYYIDGAYRGRIPYGGSRVDVCTAYNYPDCAASGFSMAFNFNDLSAGTHTLIIRAKDDIGDYNEASASFTIEKLDSLWIGDSNTVDFNSSRVSLPRDSTGNIYDKRIYLENVWVVDACKDIVFDWSTETQSWQIVDIDRIDDAFCQ